jgi:hypothetical protein
VLDKSLHKLGIGVVFSLHVGDLCHILKKQQVGVSTNGLIGDEVLIYCDIRRVFGIDKPSFPASLILNLLECRGVGKSPVSARADIIAVDDIGWEEIRRRLVSAVRTGEIPANVLRGTYLAQVPTKAPILNTHRRIGRCEETPTVARDELDLFLG